jgi:hypothetical protein
MLQAMKRVDCFRYQLKADLERQVHSYCFSCLLPVSYLMAVARATEFETRSTKSPQEQRVVASSTQDNSLLPRL